MDNTKVIEAIVRRIIREELRRHLLQPDRLVNAGEAARLTGFTEAALRRRAERELIPCVKIGRNLRFRVGDLLDLGGATDVAARPAESVSGSSSS